MALLTPGLRSVPVVLYIVFYFTEQYTYFIYPSQVKNTMADLEFHARGTVYNGIFINLCHA